MPEFEIIDANTGSTEKCVVIPDGREAPEIARLVRFAVDNEAFADNSDDEAGDDTYTVQFHGHPQEALEYDAILARIRGMLGQ